MPSRSITGIRVGHRWPTILLAGLRDALLGYVPGAMASEVGQAVDEAVERVFCGTRTDHHKPH
jgi:hypothetical protein